MSGNKICSECTNPLFLQLFRRMHLAVKHVDDYITLPERHEASQYIASFCWLHYSAARTWSNWIYIRCWLHRCLKTSRVYTRCWLHHSASKVFTLLWNDIIDCSTLTVLTTYLCFALLCLFALQLLFLDNINLSSTF